MHGEVVVDEFAWLARPDDPGVRAHLEAENAWARTEMAHTEALQERLFGEIKGRVRETDRSVPVRKGAWWYHTRTEEGRQHPVHCRRPAGPGGADPPPDAAEVVLLDENVLAAGHEHLDLGAFAVSPDARLLAYSTDTTGGEVFTLRFSDLDAGEDLAEEIPGTCHGAAWANDSATVFYVRPDDALRPYQLWRHVLRTPVADDVCVHTEHDERFHLGVGTTKDERFVILHLGSMVTDEVRVLDADRPGGRFRVVEPRHQGVEYRLEHWRDRFFIVTNAGGAEDFMLVEAPDADPGRANWQVVVPHRRGVRLHGVDVFARHLVLFERTEGLRRIRIRPLDPAGGQEHVVDQPEEVSTAWETGNPELHSGVLRYAYTSMVTPESVFDYDMATRRRTLRKRQPVLGGYDPHDYASERLWATADDGTRVPISVVHRRGLRQDGSAPALLTAYGAYDACLDPRFSSARLSLLDRGFVYAVAHVRGGGELGRRWYLAGKDRAKRTTFTDFVACAEHLVAERWTSPSRLAIRGGSAGGLLVGAAVNLRPDLFGAVVAEVPFVDPLNAILDPSLPLTVVEWEEWGNPLDSEEVYRCMRSYAPYENVAATRYPPMLVTAGLHDPRVPYWQPAKWVARLRATRTDANRLLLKTELGQGHAGASGRYDAWREEALVYAFLLDALGVAGDGPMLPRRGLR